MLTRRTHTRSSRSSIPNRNLVNHCVAVEAIMEALAAPLRALPADDVLAGDWPGCSTTSTTPRPPRTPIATGSSRPRCSTGQVDDEIIHAILAHADKAAARVAHGQGALRGRSRPPASSWPQRSFGPTSRLPRSSSSRSRSAGKRRRSRGARVAIRWARARRSGSSATSSCSSRSRRCRHARMSSASDLSSPISIRRACRPVAARQGLGTAPGLTTGIYSL